MRGFIEVPFGCGNKILLNVRYIEEVRENIVDETCTIYIAFNCPNATEQDHLQVKKSYREIVSLIERAVE
jgi:hypothetical protein